MAAVADVILNVDAKGAASELNKVDAAAKGLNGTFNALKGAIAALGIGLAVQSIAKVGTESEASKNKLKALTDQYGELATASASVDRLQKMLGISAIEARDGYSQLYGSLRGTGISAQQLEVLFVGLNKAAKLSGGGAQEAQAGILQLKQAFSSGTLSGDELRGVLENMPVFAQALAKETNALGITTNATSGDLKRLGAEGKITSDILFAAAQKLANAKIPPPTTAEQFAAALTNLQEKIAEVFGPATVAAMQRFTAVLTILGNWFTQNQAGIQGFVSALGNTLKIVIPLATGIYAVNTALAIWALRAKAVAAVQAFLLALSGPAGIAKVAAAAVAAGVAYVALNNTLNATANEVNRVKNQANSADAEFKKVNASVSGLPSKTAEAAAATAKLMQGFTSAATAAKQIQINIEGQIKSLERGASITSARYDAELAINQLKDIQLNRAYALAQSDAERLNILAQIFRNTIDAAVIEYNQKLEAIKLEEYKYQLQIQLQEAKYKEIEAEGQLQILKAGSAEEEAKKRDQLNQALAAQNESIDAARSMLDSQKQISSYAKSAAAAQLESKVVSAQTAFEQKAISDKLVTSVGHAVALSNNIKTGSGYANAMKIDTQGISEGANTAKDYYNIMASNAAKSATAINAAADAQIRLNQAQRGQNPGPAKPVPAFAEGGFVSTPTMAIIGEGRQSEYIIPANKMQAAMQRYSAGKRGQAVIPQSPSDYAPTSDKSSANTKEFSYPASVGTGNINPQINVTTGPVIDMNGKRYVSQEDLMSTILASTNQAVDQTLQMLRYNTKVRKSVGIA